MGTGVVVAVLEACGVSAIGTMAVVEAGRSDGKETSFTSTNTLPPSPLEIRVSCRAQQELFLTLIASPSDCHKQIPIRWMGTTRAQQCFLGMLTCGPKLFRCSERSEERRYCPYMMSPLHLDAMPQHAYLI